MFKNIHATAIGAAAIAGLLALSASPSFACYVTASPCTVSPAQPAHIGAMLYNRAPSGQATNLLRPSARHHFRWRVPAEANSN